MTFDKLIKSVTVYIAFVTMLFLVVKEVFNRTSSPPTTESNNSDYLIVFTSVTFIFLLYLIYEFITPIIERRKLRIKYKSELILDKIVQRLEFDRKGEKAHFSSEYNITNVRKKLDVSRLRIFCDGHMFGTECHNCQIRPTLTKNDQFREILLSFVIEKKVLAENSFQATFSTTFVDSFKKSNESFDLEFHHYCRSYHLELVFPKNRKPQNYRCYMVDQSTNKTITNEKCPYTPVLTYKYGQPVLVLNVVGFEQANPLRVVWKW